MQYFDPHVRSWEEDRRQRSKELQPKSWFRKGGYDVPLFVPHTPGEELVKRIRAKEAENNQGRRTRFKIVGRGGVTLEEKLKRSNPWAGEKKNVVEMIASNAKEREEVIAGEKVFVTTCGAMNVE